ncbi:hypothetical protein TNCV_4092811 [Trichonephila clavipes]|nr:hypothetical protein TNCV_4092811 [Trichonephila clavipes]
MSGQTGKQKVVFPVLHENGEANCSVGEGVMDYNRVEVSRTGPVSAGKDDYIDPVNKESALLDNDDVTEVHRLLDVEGAVSIKGISG